MWTFRYPFFFAKVYNGATRRFTFILVAKIFTFFKWKSCSLLSGYTNATGKISRATGKISRIYECHRKNIGCHRGISWYFPGGSYFFFFLSFSAILPRFLPVIGHSYFDRKWKKSHEICIGYLPMPREISRYFLSEGVARGKKISRYFPKAEGDIRHISWLFFHLRSKYRNILRPKKIRDIFIFRKFTRFLTSFLSNFDPFSAPNWALQFWPKVKKIWEIVHEKWKI